MKLFKHSLSLFYSTTNLSPELLFRIQTTSFVILFFDLSTSGPCEHSHYSLYSDYPGPCEPVNTSVTTLYFPHDMALLSPTCVAPSLTHSWSFFSKVPNILHCLLYRCRPGGTSLSICASSPASHFFWHRKPVLLLHLVLLISPPLLCFPRGTSCCLTPSCGESLQPQKPKAASYSQDALDLLYFAWDVFTAFLLGSIKPNEPTSVD